MDPQACFKQFCEAVQDGDFDVAACCADNYAGWLHSGGHRATNHRGEEVTHLDVERDLYGVTYGSGITEKWCSPNHELEMSA